MDLFAKIKNNASALGQYAENGGEGYFIAPKLEGPIANRMMFQGKECVCWSVNNYLGLANLPEIRKIDGDAASDWGLAYPMGSRLMTGNTSEHEALEVELAEFVKKETTALVNFGYQGMVSAIDCLVNRRDVIVYDAESHACIMDGIRLHIGKRFAFEHNNIESLEKRLQRATKITQETGGGILVISEGVFGMRGDQGKLREIVALKDKYEFRLFVRNQEQLNYFTNLVASKKPTHLLYNGLDRNLQTDLLKNCRGELVSVGKKVSKKATKKSTKKSTKKGTKKSSKKA